METVAGEPVWLGNYGVGHKAGTVRRLAREVRDNSDAVRENDCQERKYGIIHHQLNSSSLYIL